MVGVPSGAVAGIAVRPTLRMLATSAPACGSGAGAAANVVVGARSAAIAGGARSRPTEIVASVGAATRTAIDRIGRESVTGS